MRTPKLRSALAAAADLFKTHTQQKPNLGPQNGSDFTLANFYWWKKYPEKYCAPPSALQTTPPDSPWEKSDDESKKGRALRSSKTSPTDRPSKWLSGKDKRYLEPTKFVIIIKNFGFCGLSEICPNLMILVFLESWDRDLSKFMIRFWRTMPNFQILSKFIFWSSPKLQISSKFKISSVTKFDDFVKICQTFIKIWNFRCQNDKIRF